MERDFSAMVQWVWDFYNAQVAANEAIAGATDFDAGSFDPASLPDPASSSVAQAQQTANEAYTLVVAARAIADAAAVDGDAALALLANFVAGSVTVTGAATTGVFTFATAQADANYKVAALSVTRTGTPAAGSSTIVSVAKTAANLTVTVQTAPGVGNDVTFDLLVFR